MKFDEQTFTVPGPPRAKQRPRRSPAGVWYTPKPTREYEAAVAWNAHAAGVQLDGETAYMLVVDLYLSARRADVDNIVKAIQDGLNQLPGWDDKQVVTLLADSHMVRDGSEEHAVVSLVDRGPLADLMPATTSHSEE